MQEPVTIPTNTRFQNLIGQKIHRLTVIEYAGARVGAGGRRRHVWRCRCECGGEVLVEHIHMRAHRVHSCGCYRREWARERGTTHGHSRAPAFASWRGMLRRCLNPRDDHYPRYGGRGITVCDRWRESFKAFLADMGPRPSPSHSIDRIDNSGPYAPGNVRWATRLEQQNNRRTNHRVTHQGITRTVAEWARSVGMGAEVLNSRLRLGWPMERALTEPVK